MPHSIEFTPHARRQFDKLDHSVKERVAPIIDALADNPRPPGTAKLHRQENRYRQRAGDYRIVYDVWDADAVVSIALIRHRRDAYPL